MKVVWDESVLGMRVVLDESGFGMKVVLDENFWDEKCQFHLNLDESVPNHQVPTETNCRVLKTLEPKTHHQLWRRHYE